MILDLGPMGQLQTQTPDSLAVAFEFTSIWAGESDSSVIARLCAGAIGIYIDKSARLPKYRPFTHKPLEYGHTCLDRLLKANVLPGTIYEQGAKCLADMARQIPTEAEVKEKVNFTASGEEAT